MAIVVHVRDITEANKLELSIRHAKVDQSVFDHHVGRYLVCTPQNESEYMTYTRQEMIDRFAFRHPNHVTTLAHGYWEMELR